MANIRMFDMRKIEGGPELAECIDNESTRQILGGEQLGDVTEEQLSSAEQERPGILPGEEESLENEAGYVERDRETEESNMGRGKRIKLPTKIFSYHM